MKKSYLVFILLCLAAVLAALWFFFLRDSTVPAGTLAPAQNSAVSKQTEFTIQAGDKGSGIKSVEIKAVQGNRESPVFSKAYPDEPENITEKFSLPDIPLTDGALTLDISVTDGTSRNRAGWRQAFTMDTQPPVLSFQGMTQYVRQGGTAFVRYSVSEEVSATGVQVGDYFFSGYQQGNGDYLCYFACPHAMGPDAFAPVLTATDKVGNEKKMTLDVNTLPRIFKSKTMVLNEAWLNRIMSDFQPKFSGSKEPLEFFLKVNRDLRKEADDIISKVGLETSPVPLWADIFLRQPDSATLAEFADFREYILNDRKVDEQYHLGVDLASTKNAGILAANAGRVVFTGELTIYGQTVIIDHGLGLQSLYAHMSEIGVKKGDQVTRGQVIGKTGMTGLAAGDHLHFGLYVSGVAVTPIEWWDPLWIKASMTSPEGQAGETAESAGD